MIEYANEDVIKLLKQYDMFSKTLNFTTDLEQKNDICDQMTKIIENILNLTNASYEEKYFQVANRSVYLMDEEKNRLLELINLINERRAYVNNQIITNKELTGLGLDVGSVLGEDKIEDYKAKVKIIDKYKNNQRLEVVLNDEIKSLDLSIKNANTKISNNKNLNRQLEERMIKLVNSSLNKLSLYELQEREKEIDLAYTELGYSLEKAKENAKIARRDCSEEIILECDNMLASITLEYERYKEKKLILKLISIYEKPVNTYEEILNKREEINNILLGITSSELYSIIGNELNKEYATIKLEQQDVATLKSLMEEKDSKIQALKDIAIENNSEEFKELLSSLLENEKKYQEQLRLEKKKKEQELLEIKRQEELKKQEEMAKRQKAIEEERKKEIERRTKQLLVEKQNPVLMTSREEREDRREYANSQKNSSDNSQLRKKSLMTPNPILFPSKSNESGSKKIEKREDLFNENRFKDSSQPKRTTSDISKDDFFTRENRNTKIVDQGIPVIKNKNLDNEVVAAASKEENSKVFPDIPLEKKENIFPDFPDINKTNSFFDENEFNDLSNYIDDDKKKSWF